MYLKKLFLIHLKIRFKSIENEYPPFKNKWETNIWTKKFNIKNETLYIRSNSYSKIMRETMIYLYYPKHFMITKYYLQRDLAAKCQHFILEYLNKKDFAYKVTYRLFK